MQDNYFSFIKEWFHGYVQGFYSADEQLHFHVRLKEEHTLRVVTQATTIAKWLELSVEKVELAKIGALLHDIGRFTQYQTYRTFNDALSVNHGKLGLEVLEESNILTLAGLPLAEQEIIKKTVLYHNLRQLPMDIKEDCSLFAKIIRDADKLDIFAMLTTVNTENKIPKPPEVNNAMNYSLEIIETIFQGNLVTHAAIKTVADLMLFRLSWLYDIYFTYSFTYILKEQYVEKLIATLPGTDDMHQVSCCLTEYVKKHSLEKEQCSIRIACLDDIKQITEIYNQGIEDRIATLEADTKSVEQMVALFKARSTRHKMLVAVTASGSIKGWASLNIFNARECYQGVADLSIYICRSARGKGIGKLILLALIETAKQVGFHKMVLSTMAHNYIGHKLYAAVGFTKVGTYIKQGKLDGKWIDITIMEKLLVDE